MKNSLLIIGSILISSTPALAIEALNGGAYLGYQIVEVEGDFDGGGFAVGIEGHAVFSRLGTVGVLGGLGLERSSFECSENNVEIEANETNFGFMGGLDVPINGQYSLQSLMRYDFGISGSGHVVVGTARRKADIDTFNRLTHEWRLLAEVTPLFTVGASLKWFRGEFEFDGDTADRDFKGYTIGAIVTRRF